MHCSDCGALLRDVWEDEDATQPEAVEADYPSGEYWPVAGRVSAREAEAIIGVLDAAAVPTKIEATRSSQLLISVRREDRDRAVSLLVEAGLREPDGGADVVAVGAEGGPCPACGAEVRPGTDECPVCSLVLGGDAPECEKCGTVLTASEACKECGHLKVEE